MIKKSNRISTNFSNEAILCLQRMGYLNGQKKATGDKNISKFISRLVIDFVGLNNPQDHKFIKEKLLKIELMELQKQRDKLEQEMKIIAENIVAVKEMNNGN